MQRVYSLLVIAVALVALDFIAVRCAYAATPSVTVNWTAPTTAVDGTALTGAQAVTSYQVWIATTSIPDTVSTPPTATVTTGTTTTQSVTANPGDTIFARVKACNAGGCSVLTAQASKTLPVGSPNPPTSVTITLTAG